MSHGLHELIWTLAQSYACLIVVPTVV